MINFCFLYKVNKYSEPKIVNISTDNFEWVENLKSSLKESETNPEQRTLLVVEGNPLSGVIGLVNCIRREPNGKNLR